MAGTYTLAALGITTALTASTQTAIDAEGRGASLVAELAGGTGGATVFVLVQTRYDGGTWYDVARFDFNTADSPPATGAKSCVIGADIGTGVTVYAALSAEGVNAGLFGDELRAVITSTGTYTGSTTLNVRATVF